MDIEGELETPSAQNWRKYKSTSTGMKMRVIWISCHCEQMSRLHKKGLCKGPYAMYFGSSHIYYSVYFINFPLSILIFQWIKLG